MKRSRCLTLFSLLVALTLTGCNNGSSGSGNDDTAGTTPPTNSPPTTSPDDQPTEPAAVLVPSPGEGYAQKGPFQNGTTVMVEGLNPNGSLSGNTWSTETGSDGKISFQGIGWEGLAMVTVTGHYFNEITGTWSPGTFRLRAVMPVSGSELVGNVNLFTHLAARYYEYWMPDGYSYEELRDDYLNDYLMTWFGLSTLPENLNLLDSIDPETDRDSYMLLLYSAAMASIGMTQEELDALAEDFATTDAGYGEDWPEGTGKDALVRLVKEAQENEATLVAQARQNLEAEFGRSSPAVSSGANRVAGTICVYADLLCEWGDLYNVPFGPVHLDIPVSINHAGSYGVLINFNGSSQGATAVFSDTPGGSAIRSSSGSASSFIEFMVRPLAGVQRYNLRLASSLAKEATRISLFSLSQGTEAQPYPLRIGDNAGRVGIEWGTSRNTDSYYQLIAGPGRYQFTIGGYPCGTQITPVIVRGYQWEWDIREPLPEGQVTNTPFNTAATVTSDQNSCSHQFELENDTQPNRLYVHLEAIGLRDTMINTNRAIHHKYTIRVRRL